MGGFKFPGGGPGGPAPPPSSGNAKVLYRSMLPILYGNLLYKMGNYFLDIQ